MTKLILNILDSSQSGVPNTLSIQLILGELRDTINAYNKAHVDSFMVYHSDITRAFGNMNLGY